MANRISAIGFTTTLLPRVCVWFCAQGTHRCHHRMKSSHLLVAAVLAVALVAGAWAQQQTLEPAGGLRGPTGGAVDGATGATGVAATGISGMTGVTGGEEEEVVTVEIVEPVPDRPGEGKVFVVFTLRLNGVALADARAYIDAIRRAVFRRIDRGLGVSLDDVHIERLFVPEDVAAAASFLQLQAGVGLASDSVNVRFWVHVKEAFATEVAADVREAINTHALNEMIEMEAGISVSAQMESVPTTQGAAEEVHAAQATETDEAGPTDAGMALAPLSTLSVAAAMLCAAMVMRAA